MNTFVYLRGKEMNKNQSKQPYYLFVPIIILLGFALTKSVLAKTEVNTQEITQATSDVLTETENAIKLLRIDANTSLTSVENAIKAIELIEKSYTHNTLAHTERKHNTEIAESFEHFYPKLDERLLESISSLPTLSYKINSGIVYKGSDQERHTTDAFLDYTFAKASLVTAKNAIKGNDALEAMANLKRVFEAVYVAPDFDVSAENR